jgi:hypothetical protein
MVLRPVQFLLWVGIAFLASCSPEPLDFQCADPLGTDRQTVLLNYYDCFGINTDDCFRFRYSNGHPIFNAVYNQDRTFPTLLDIGDVACLSMVTNKPVSGYQIGVEVKLHHGYVIRLADGSFGRLYVDSWLIGNDSVRQVNIKRQYAY